MTLCLPGVSERGDAIVSVFDSQATLTDGSGNVLATSQTTVKGARVSKQWAIFYAGDDTRHVGFVIDVVKNAILAKPRVSLAQAKQAVTKACSDVLCDCIEFEVLAKYQITLKEFWHRGRQRITDPAVYATVRRAVDTTNLDLDFLLAGFGARSNIAHLVVLKEGYQAFSCDREGFGAIGAGDVIARRVVNHLGYSTTWSSMRAAYVLCAAKFSAEADQTVGKLTNVSLFKRDGSLWTLDAETVRQIWKGSPKSIPTDLDQRMPPFRQISGPDSVRRVARSIRKGPKRGR